MQLTVPLSLHNQLSPQATQQKNPIQILLRDGLLDHYIVQAPYLVPVIVIEDELYARTDDIAYVKIKDRFGKHMESYRVYRKVSP